MVSLYLRPLIASLMALLYDISLRILLLHLLIDIAVLVYSLFYTLSATMDLLFSNNIVASIRIIFLSLPFSLSSFAGAFFSTKVFHLKAT